MGRIFFRILLVFFVFFSSNIFAQIQKGSLQAGISSAALFELNSEGLNGGLFYLNAEYSINNRFVLGLQPYYAFTQEKVVYAFDVIAQQPRDIYKDSFHSIGANLELKFILLPANRIKPYSAIVIGAGFSNYKLYQSDVRGELVAHQQSDFINYNLGVGLGAYFKLSRTLYIDGKILYTDVSANKAIESSQYLYPTIGLLKSF